MRTLIQRRLLPWLVAASCLAPTAVLAVGAEVRDAAGLFSPAALKQADETVRRIQKEFRKDLLVETFSGVPANRTADYTRNREEFFSNFVRERAQSSRIDGIYVLVLKEPPPHRYRIQVAVGQATRQRAFMASDREELVRLLQSHFREDRFDDGLRGGVAYVERALRNNLPAGSLVSTAKPGSAMRETASPGTSPGSWLVIILFVVGGILLVGFLMRLLRRGMGGGMAGGYGGGSGGGFLSSLMGGIGGAIAGSWLYDRFLSGNAHAADNYNPGASEGSSSDVGGDWSSSGGDADSSSGGDDFDGGGGGDFGGGDA